MLGGQLQLAFGASITTLPHVKSGRLRALAIGDAKRSEFLPELPTLAESGVPGYAAVIWNGMLAPANTPRVIIDRLYRAIVAIITTPEFRQRMASLGSDIVGSTPAAWGGFIQAEIAKWSRIARTAGITSHAP